MHIGVRIVIIFIGINDFAAFIDPVMRPLICPLLDFMSGGINIFFLFGESEKHIVVNFSVGFLPVDNNLAADALCLPPYFV